MRPDLIRGHLELVLLGILSQGAGHGYEIITRLRDRTDGTFDLNEGSVYPPLHRLDAAHRITADGLSSFDAELAAVQHFGPVGPMVDAERRRAEVPLVAVARQVTATALLFGAIGAIAVGISGVFAGIFKLVAGSRAL